MPIENSTPSVPIRRSGAVDPIKGRPLSRIDIAKLREQQEDAVAKFLEARNVDAGEVNAFLFGPYGGESSDRAYLFAQWASTLKPSRGGKAFWEVVRQQWSSFDRIDHAEYQRQFRRFAPYWAATSEVTDLEDEMVVYRGQSSLSPLGLSWSLRRDVAESFARGHRSIRVLQPVVLERRIRREQVALAINEERNEAEIVLWAPPRNLQRR